MATLLVALVRASGASAADIDLANPTTGIVDPAGGLAPVNTECSAGQVDLNLDSLATISERLNLASDPTVKRLMGMRPWLKGSDLSSVPGIGPVLSAELAPKTCATQPKLPVPTPLACQPGSTAVDLQTANAGTISKRAGLPLESAQALIAARPLPQDLTQVIAPRVPGLSLPILQSLLSAKRICVTPAPMLAAGAAWRWATATGGVIVGRDGFRLVVPPGRVTEPAGAYASVKPLEPDGGVLPRMDAHIHGAWSGNVAVQGPWSPQQEDDHPVVLHDAADGPRLSIGSSVAQSIVDGRPTATALQTSLSETTWGATACASAPPADGVSPVGFCLEHLTDGSLARQWQDSASTLGARSSGLLEHLLDCRSGGTPVSFAKAAGQLKFGLSCMGPTLADPPFMTGTATWGIGDEAHLDLYLTSAQVVYDYSAEGDAARQLTVPGDVTTDPFGSAVLGVIQSNSSAANGMIFPGQTLSLSQPPGFGSTTLWTDTDPAMTAVWSGTLLALDTLENWLGKKTSVAIIAGLQGDLYAAVDQCAGGVIDKVKCATAWLKAETNILANKPGDTSLASRARTLSRVFKVADIASFASSFVSSFAYEVVGGGHIVFTNTPNRPTKDSKGRAVFPQCLRQTETSYFVDETCQDRLYGGTGTGADGTIREDSNAHVSVMFRLAGEDGRLIGSYFIDAGSAVASLIVPPSEAGEPDTFACLSRRYPLRDWLPESKLFDYGDQESTKAATCAPSTPERQLSGDETNWILRKSDGEAWFIDGQSVRHPIDSGHVYQCLAQSYYVLNAATDTEVSRYSSGNTADCA